MSGKSLEQLRGICLALPEVMEKPFGGHADPTWRVRDKIFVMFNGSDHGDGELSLWCKAPPGAQDILVGGDPARFFVPALRRPQRLGGRPPRRAGRLGHRCQPGNRQLSNDRAEAAAGAA